MLARMLQKINDSRFASGNIKMGQVLPNTTRQLLKKLNIELPYDSEFPLRGIHFRKMKTYVHTKICTGMFTAVLFLIAKKMETT